MTIPGAGKCEEERNLWLFAAYMLFVLLPYAVLVVLPGYIYTKLKEMAQRLRKR